MNKEYDKYLSQANFDIQNQEEHNNLKEYVACILYDNDRKDKEIERLNNIINELEKWLNEYYKSNRKWYNFELSNHDKKYFEETYRNTEFMIVKFLDKLKELKGGE